MTQKCQDIDSHRQSSDYSPSSSLASPSAGASSAGASSSAAGGPDSSITGSGVVASVGSSAGVPASVDGAGTGEDLVDGRLARHAGEIEATGGFDEHVETQE